jgi:hypothetical protein
VASYEPCAAATKMVDKYKMLHSPTKHVPVWQRYTAVGKVTAYVFRPKWFWSQIQGDRKVAHITLSSYILLV